MTHPHLDGLIRKWRDLSRHEDEHGELEVGNESAIRLRLCADELEAALAALQGGGVARVVAHRLHQPNHSSAWISGDYSGPEPKRRGWSVERAYSLPTPNPHEADRNG